MDSNELKPPKWPDKFLDFFCGSHLLEEVKGDLHERYLLRVNKYGRKQAARTYWREVLAYLRPSVIKRNPDQNNPMITRDLITENIRFSWRSLMKNKAFSAINISGLALGLACFLLIYLWGRDELRTDRFHSNNNNLYRVYMNRTYGEFSETSYKTSALLPAELKKAIPEIELATGFAKELRLAKPGLVEESFQNGDIKFKMKGSRAGPDFFQMFSYPLIMGSPETALNEPTGIAISRTMADLFFGGPEKALSEPITFNHESGTKELKVTAVFEDIPSFSTDRFDYLTHWDDWVQNDDFKKHWGHNGTLTYVQLSEYADPEQVEQKLSVFFYKHLGFKKREGSNIALGIQPYADHYLYGNFENGKPSDGRIVYVRIMGAIAIFILLIATVNFMNLSIARALKKSKEVGVRKVIGAGRLQLAFKFMGDALMYATIAMIVALMAVALALPWLNTLTGKSFVVTDIGAKEILIILGAAGLTAVLSGGYPAIFLSSFHPVKALKGAQRISPATLGLKKGLVVFQFIVSIIMIISAIVVTQQTGYLQSKDLGYDRENLLYINLEGPIFKDYLSFKNEAMRLPGIKIVDRSARTPHNMGENSWAGVVQWEGSDPENPISFSPSSVGYDFIKAMGLTIVEGRDFSRDFPSDTTNFIINEFAVKQMGLEDPIGAEVVLFGKKGMIVGVVDDFITRSLHNTLTPVILDIKEHNNFGTIVVRTEAGKMQEALEGLKMVYNRFNPGYAFTWTFLDDKYRLMYKTEETIKRLSNTFGIVAIVIACLGLLGLSFYSAEQRTREIGIRKVFGASVANIYILFSREFLLLTSISVIIACPVGWYFMQEWLAGFTYHISLQWWVFVLAGSSTIIIALLTIFYHALRVAIRNPVEALRQE